MSKIFMVEIFIIFSTSKQLAKKYIFIDAGGAPE